MRSPLSPLWAILCAGALLAGPAACHKGSDPTVSAAPSGPPGTAAAPRHVEITVSNLGYMPARILGRPGEELLLVFRYSPSAGECGREVVLLNPKGPVRLTLSAERPVEVAMSLPKDRSEVGFTCGMGMLRGTLVVQ